MIKTSTLDNALSSQAYIDFLKFDIQGFEGRALSGAAEILKRTNVIHCEVFFAPMYHDSALFTDIEAILRGFGFEFIDFHHLTRCSYIDVPINHRPAKD